MSIDGARDLNVFFSSPRVGLGEPPPASSTSSSLLTFADMVLALDRQNISDSFEFRSLDVDFNAESDHTYASSGFSRTTRSQTAKAAAHLTNRFHLPDHQESDSNQTLLKKGDNDGVHTFTSLRLSQSVSKKCVPLPSDPHHLRGKRCSSVENIYNAETELTVNVCKVCERPEGPEVLPKNSPRKSSSFEEVGCDNSKSCLKSSKSSEHVQRAGISYSLHRFVNNTMEFPCWPRKADHTYATATWDGTAASHSLFEQELRQVPSRPHIIEDQEMEDTDSCYTGHNQSDQSSETLGNLQNCTALPQKEDHTYVKSTFVHFNSPDNIYAEAFNLETDTDTISDNLRTQTFSSATFPRQKVREDHTYFHSGFSRKSTGGAVGREWASTHTVASSSPQEDLKIEEAYRNMNSFSQSASTKRDHNYSTSA